MRWSGLFIPTLREAPADAEVASHKLLLRAGYVRQLGAGLYSHLFLARRAMRKIERIVREEMDAIGAQEIHLPALHPSEVWRQSGRWDAMGDNMFRLRDRWGRNLCLGMTHEEVIAALALGELRSYKQLPQMWYQIQTKFRDEPRPKAGLLRVREFLMKDSYSFDIDAAGLDASYARHYDAYTRIFARCGLDVIVVEAHSGAMGGSRSHEFMVRSEAGEDFVVTTASGSYAANLEKAVSIAAPPPKPDPEGDLEPGEFHTPGQKTIAEIAAFTGLPPQSQMKSLVMVATADGKDTPALAVVRGDHTLSETKLAGVLGAAEVRPAHPEEIREWFGAGAGSLGPVRAPIRVLADSALQGRRNMICGANRDDYHLRHVTPGEDFTCEFHDLRQAAAGDTSAATGEPLSVDKAMEIGHIFQLGYKYSEAFGLRVLDAAGKEVTPIMGSYGIGMERILCAAIEQRNDAAGMILPRAIAPFEAVVTPVSAAEPAQMQAAEAIYAALRERGVDVLLDDRDERPGVKFKDADLIGVPCRVTCGRGLAQGKVEVTVRASGEKFEAEVAEAAAAVERVLGD
ncbi:MAG: proline--tRNA ligase [Bryobacteraceae bacterium]